MNIKVYQSGLKFMLINAVKKLYNGDVIFHHSLDYGLYFSIENTKIEIDEEEVKKIKKEMEKMVEAKIPFNKRIVKKKDAVDFYNKKGEIDKASNVTITANSAVTLYEFEGKFNYFYTDTMPKDTSLLSVFDIYYIETNKMVLIYPYPLDQEIKYTFRRKIYETFDEYNKWLKRIDVPNVSSINHIIAMDEIKDLIMKNDIKSSTDLFKVGDEIITRNKRICLIAGPSSSGKTTTSRKLALHLSSLGYKAHSLSLDDFFLDLEETPLDKDGNKDFESIKALDLKLFNESLKKLIDGEEVDLPTYNFIKGKKEYIMPPLKIDRDDIIIIEGLHGINPALFDDEIDKDLLYRIYVSPLMPLNIDNHNYISSTDNRLLRRIVRDFKTRGKSAEETLSLWESVRKGEEEYIFPYTDTVDIVLNTAYIYEIGVLKVFAEPLLYSIDVSSPYYEDARRLLDYLKVFYPISSEYISPENLLREFIGNGIWS